MCRLFTQFYTCLSFLCHHEICAIYGHVCTFLVIIVPYIDICFLWYLFHLSIRHMIHVILCHLWACVSFDICAILHSFPSFCCIPLGKISLISNMDWCKNLLVCCKFKFQSWRGVFDTTIGDQVCQWLTSDLWFSLGTPVSSTKKTDWHDITEILLKVVLSTIAIIQMTMENVST